MSEMKRMMGTVLNAWTERGLVTDAALKVLAHAIRRYETGREGYCQQGRYHRTYRLLRVSLPRRWVRHGRLLRRLLCDASGDRTDR